MAKESASEVLSYKEMMNTCKYKRTSKILIIEYVVVNACCELFFHTKIKHVAVVCLFLLNNFVR